MRLVLLGPPGSGKGVQGELIQKRLNIPRISTGDMFRETVKKESPEGDELRKYMESGKLVPDEVVIRMTQKRLSDPDCSNGFILDGFPRTVHQGESLEKMLGEWNIGLDYVVSLEVSNELIVERITTRRVCSGCGAVYNVKTNPPPEDLTCPNCGEKIIQRSDDFKETVLKRLNVYEEQTKPLKDFYKPRGILAEVDGGGTIDEIQSRIIGILTDGQ